MDDDELKASWKLIKEPRAALCALLENSMFIGTDPYYRDLNDALWEMAKRVAAETEQRCCMCGEPRDGRDHSGCDVLPF